MWFVISIHNNAGEREIQTTKCKSKNNINQEWISRRWHMQYSKNVPKVSYETLD